MKVKNTRLKVVYNSPKLDNICAFLVVHIQLNTKLSSGAFGWHKSGFLSYKKSEELKFKVNNLILFFYKCLKVLLMCDYI